MGKVAQLVVVNSQVSRTAVERVIPRACEYTVPSGLTGSQDVFAAAKLSFA